MVYSIFLNFNFFINKIGASINKRDYVKVQTNRRNVLMVSGRRKKGRKFRKRQNGKKEGRKLFFHYLVDVLTYI